MLVIHTPRLCGEPGFKSERDTHEESVLRCREVLSDEAYESVQRTKAIADAAASSSSSSVAAAASAGSKKTTGTGTGTKGDAPEPSYTDSIHPFHFAPGLRPPPPVPQPAAAPGEAPAAVKAVQEVLAKMKKDGTIPGAGAGAAIQDGGPQKKRGKTAESVDAIRKALKALLGEEAAEDVEIIDIDSSASSADSASPTGADAGTGGGTEAAVVVADIDVDADTLHVEGGKVSVKTIAEALGRRAEDVVEVVEDDGTTSFYILDNMDDAEVDDLDSIGRKFLDRLTGKNKDPTGKGSKQDGRHAVQNGDDEADPDDYVPETHDEL